jgi:Flp pilus assembly protein TadD
MPDLSAHRMRPHILLLALVLALSSQLVSELVAAQTPAGTAPTPQVTDPREMSEAARKAYSKGLKDARELITEKKYAEAIGILDSLSAERPREPQARFLKGVALADSGRTDDAIAVYLSLAADFPELPEVRNNLAVLYGQKGNYEGARDELVAAIMAAPDYAIAYENLGDVYARLAGINYEKAIARDAKNKSAPPKLKLVREVLGMRAPPPAEASAPQPAAGGVTPAATTDAPAATADAPK